MRCLSALRWVATLWFVVRGSTSFPDALRFRDLQPGPRGCSPGTFSTMTGFPELYSVV
jgi:hypothetical protein